MFELLIQYTVICFATLIMGWLTTKFSIYGLLLTGVIWVCYMLVPGLDAGTVWATMWPRFIDLWLFYPTFIRYMMEAGWANYGLLGVVLYALIAILPVIPYLSGIVSGFFFWPELLLMRVIL